MVLVYECCLGVNGVFISRFVMLIILFMGVCSLWLIVVKNVDFMCVDFYWCYFWCISCWLGCV